MESLGLASKCLASTRMKSRSDCAGIEGVATRLRDGGRELFELVEITARPEHEHAAVPIVIAGYDELLGPLRDSAFSTNWAMRCALPIASPRRI